MGEQVIVLTDLTKQYGNFTAVDHIRLNIRKGEIFGLLGPNGAGKSTTILMMLGLTEPTSGTVEICGINSTTHPIEVKRKIGYLPEDVGFYDDMTGPENLIYTARLNGISDKEAKTKAMELMKRVGLEEQLTKKTGKYSRGMRQRLGLADVLIKNPEIIILDEPTSVLSPLALKALFKTLRQLSSEGVSIIFITHKLNEIRALSKNCCVIRGGQVVANVNPQEISEDDLAKLMIGNDLPEILPKPEVKQALGLDLNLRGEKVSYKSHFPLSGQIHVPCGKIVGIAGISGNGQSDLMKAISGEALLPKDAISICGAPVGDLRVKHRRAMGLRYVPEERLGQATVPEMSLESNTLLTSNLFLAKGFMRNKMIHRFTETVIEKFKVKSGGSHAPAASLSGGNLQKFIVGRELLHNPKILVLNQPTWGVDAGAAALIRNALIRQRTGGSAVLVVSEELDELFEICDEIVVMSEGKISPQVKISDVSIEEIGRWMSGLWPQKSEAPKEASV